MMVLRPGCAGVLLFAMLASPAAGDSLPASDPLLSLAQHHHIDPTTYQPPSAATARPPVRQRQAIFGVIAVMVGSLSLLTIKLAGRRHAIGKELPSPWRVDAPRIQVCSMEPRQPHLRRCEMAMN
jgi:hypothetical protein